MTDHATYVFDGVHYDVITSPRRPRGRAGWTRTHKGRCGGTWRHDASGWIVEHCGHPTALYPYLGYAPSGFILYAPNGKAFAHLVDAQAAVEAQLAKGGAL